MLPKRDVYVCPGWDTTPVRGAWVMKEYPDSPRPYCMDVPNWCNWPSRHYKTRHISTETHGYPANPLPGLTSLPRNDVAALPNPKLGLLDLPAELRMRIYELLVQRGCVFIMNPVYKGKHLCALTKVIPDTGAQQHFDISLLMRVSRQIKEEVYSVLYGDNTFVFRVGCKNYPQTRFQIKDSRPSQVWTKAFDFTNPPLWPLTRDTIKHVRFVSLIVQPFPKRSKRNYESVRQTIESSTNLLKEATHLKTLDIFLRQPHVMKDYWWPLSTGLTVEYNDTNGLSALLSENSKQQSTKWRNQFLLEPLSSLCNIKNVSVAGGLSPAFAGELKSAMMKDIPVELHPSPLDGKRKRVLEKRRPGYSKRRRVDVPVLEYWQPKYEWNIAAWEDA